MNRCSHVNLKLLLVIFSSFQDMYVYISEDLKGISNFTNANLIWEQGGLVYGDWYAGADGDGTYVFSTDVEVSKVLLLSFFRCLHTFRPSSSSLCLLLFHFLAFVRLDFIIFTTAKYYIYTYTTATACLLALRVLSASINVFIKRRSHIFAFKNSVNKVDYLSFKSILNFFGSKYFFYLVFFPIQRVQNNGSIYLHTYIVPKGFSPDPTKKHLYSKSLTLHASKMINKFKKKRYVKTHNLLSGETVASIEEQEVCSITYLVKSKLILLWV